MRPPRQLPRYRRGLPYGYVLGHFATMELLRHAPGIALEVRVHGDLDAERREVLRRACDAAGVGLIRDDAAVEARRSKGSARVLAVFEKPRATLDGTVDHLLLVRTREPGNAGTILRTALAFGVEDVALVGGVDAFSPHVLRASLGAAFALRLASFPDLGAYRAAHPRHELWLLDGDADVELAEAPPVAGPRALAVGPEWPGFEPAELRLGRSVRIALDPRVESLNAAVAAGVALHALGPRGPRR